MVEKRNAASDHGGSGIPEDFVVLVDADWKVAVWSTAARRLLGYTAEEITGRAAAELLALGLPQSARQHILAVTPWTSQVVLILVGHVAAVWLSHAEALHMEGSTRKAALNQLPMLVLMVVFTAVGLWVLAQPLQG